MNLKNKILITFLFSLLLILFFNINNVFARTITSGGSTYDLPDNLPQDSNKSYALLWITPGSNPSCYLSSTELRYNYYPTAAANMRYRLQNADLSIYDIYVLSNGNSGNWVKSTTSNSLVQTIGSSDIIEPNFDFYEYNRDSGERTLLFQPPVPEPVEEPEEIQLEGTLAPIVAEIPETKEILQEIIHLLPVIMSVLVSLLALRKALAFLMAHLRTS